jgi:hypothetical protein
MADPTSSPGATPEAGATPPEENQSTNDNTTTDELGEAGKRALADLRRELKETRTERDALRTAARDAADAERTDLEKAVRDRDDVTVERDTLREKALKMEAAIEAGIPDQWRRLIGNTPEELLADAKSYAEQLTGSSAPPPGDLGSGARPGTPATGVQGFNEAIRRRARR